MGNIISFNHCVTADDDSLVMSNGLTDVLLDYLLLGGAKLAKTDTEKRMMVFLGEKIQSVYGIGTVGFAVTDMPWQAETFAADRGFLLHTVQYARELTVDPAIHEMLGYSPNPDHISYALDGFEALVSRMTADDISPDALQEWLSYAEEDDPVYRGYPQCPKHGIYLSCIGCKVCIENVGTYPVSDEDLEKLAQFWYGSTAPQGANTDE